MEKIFYNIGNIASTAKEVLSGIDKPQVVCFNGPMGVGKTTLIKALIKELGAVDSGSSPTFGLVNEYEDTAGNTLAYHFDFYRINSEQEALDMGVEDYFDDEKWVFIEWPERILGLIPTNSVFIKLAFVDKKEHLNDKNVRFIELSTS